MLLCIETDDSCYPTASPTLTDLLFRGRIHKYKAIALTTFLVATAHWYPRSLPGRHVQQKEVRTHPSHDSLCRHRVDRDRREIRHEYGCVPYHEVRIDGSGGNLFHWQFGTERASHQFVEKLNELRTRPGPVASSASSAEERLRAVARLYQDGLVTREEFEAKRASLLSELCWTGGHVL